VNAAAVFNRYDIRGSYPDEIDAEFAERIGKAAGTYAQRHGRGTVVTGRDTRDSSETVYGAFLSGIRATGAEVVDVGVGTTDRTALAAQHYGGIGVMVTASHHAWERTGFKFLYEQGNGFTNDDLATIRDLFETQAFARGNGTRLTVQDEFDEIYIDTVQSSFHDIIDTDLDTRVLLDAAGGAQRTAAIIFEELGAEVIPIDREDRAHPEPREDTRQDVQQRLQETTADIAVGYDPDGDRVYVIHPDQGWMDGDRLFYLLATIVDADEIVASVDTAPFIEQLDAAVTYTRVGDVFVAEKGVETGADLLGEPNRHYAVTDFCWYNSGIFASLLFAATHDRFDDLLGDVQDAETHRFVETYSDPDARDAAMTDVKKQVAKHFDVLDTVDGLKFTDDGFTGLVRPSGTSPKIRLIIHTDDRTVDPATVHETVFA
jgi:phosphomannomutase